MDAKSRGKTSSRTTNGGTLGIHKIPRAHLVGIGGCGMRSLADVLAGIGWDVSGSDQDAESLAGIPFNTHHGHPLEVIDADLDAVIFSDAVPRTNPQLQRARKLRLFTASYAQMLGRLSGLRNAVAVAGTHGKSTTTAMAGEILVAAGFDPTVVYGAAPLGGSSGGRFGRGRTMLVEACEYKSNFLHLKPELAVVLGIEPDHFDCFRTPKALEQAFAQFAEQVPAEGLLLARGDCPATARVIQNLACTHETFGIHGSATWQASELRERRGCHSFRIRCRGRLVCDVKLRVAGRHNVLNALAAAALASHCGATGNAIRMGLDRFVGLHRRLELVADRPELAIVDDYAHHPTEVTAALTTLRLVFPDRRLWCVFQPHQTSRTRRLLDEFAASLQNADKTIVAEVFRAREPAVRGGQDEAQRLVARTRALGADAVQLAEAAEIHDHLQQHLRPGDVVVTLGAGDIGKISHELGKGFRKFRQAG